MSAEDLTIQAGLALQQDLALVSLMGITHVERNGHHYVNGMAGAAAERTAGLFRTRTPTCTNAAMARCACASTTAVWRSVRWTASVLPAAQRPDWSAMRPMQPPCRCMAAPPAGEPDAGPRLGRPAPRRPSSYYLPSVAVMAGCWCCGSWPWCCWVSRSTSCRRRWRRCAVLADPNYQWTANFLATLYAVLGAFVLSAVLGIGWPW